MPCICEEMRVKHWMLGMTLVAFAVGCGDDDANGPRDGGQPDGGSSDGGPSDAGSTPDAATDGGPLPTDSGTTPDGGGTVALSFDFEDGTYQGFTVDQTDFTELTRGELEHAVEALPAPLSGQGLRVDAHNRSDDQWSYIVRARW